jgi:hypothetical protein
MQLSRIEDTIAKWMKPKDRKIAQLKSDKFFNALSKRWRNLYPSNVYKMNEKALLIQHWFFRTMIKLK